MADELLESRGVRFKRRCATSSHRRLDLVGLSPDVLDRYPIELSGGMKQRVVMVLSTLLDPSLLIADEITSALDVSTQKAVAQALVELPRPRLRQEHDRHHPRPVRAVPDRGHDPRDVRGQAGGEGAHRGHHRGAASSLHAAAHLVAPEVGVRYEDRRLEGIPGRPPSLLDPPAGCRFRARCPLASTECLEEPPFVEIEPGHWVACWKVA